MNERLKEIYAYYLNLYSEHKDDDNDRKLITRFLLDLRYIVGDTPLYDELIELGKENSIDI